MQLHLTALLLHQSQASVIGGAVNVRHPDLASVLFALPAQRTKLHNLPTHGRIIVGTIPGQLVKVQHVELRLRELRRLRMIVHHLHRRPQKWPPPTTWDDKTMLNHRVEAGV